MKSHLITKTILFVAVGFLATTFLTETTGPGIDEPISDERVISETEVAAVKVPDSSPGTTAINKPAPVADVVSKKHTFINALLPYIETENRSVAELRDRLEAIQDAGAVSDDDRAWLERVGRKYRLSTNKSDTMLIAQLLARVDKLPPSLVLAQAALESGWGTSRFAREGNNLFGQWCMTKGCGMVPRGRDADASHEVKRFNSVQDSVHGYFMNINTNRAYRPLRELRSCQREQGESLSGPMLAGGLLQYSTIRHRYIETLRDVIRVNRWEPLDGEERRLAAVDYSTSHCFSDIDLAQGSVIAAGE